MTNPVDQRLRGTLPPLSIAVLPPTEAYDYDWVASRIHDTDFLTGSVAVRIYRVPLLAVPSGGCRRGGRIDAGPAAVALAIRAALRGRPGFPLIRAGLCPSPGGDTMREGEEPEPVSVLGIRYSRRGTPAGLCYRLELPRDRDDRGVLWARTSQNLALESRRPMGKPDFAAMHPARQRDVMSSLRCQVCHGQASRTELGYLFLERAGDGMGEGTITGQPPVCLEHAAAGIKRCSHLQDHGYVLLRSKVPRLYGVLSQVFKAVDHTLEPLPPLLAPDGSNIPIPYTTQELTPWVLASQLLRQLRGVTVVDPEQELAALQATPRKELLPR